jgi:hypothetical protein
VVFWSFSPLVLLTSISYLRSSPLEHPTICDHMRPYPTFSSLHVNSAISDFGIWTSSRRAVAPSQRVGFRPPSAVLSTLRSSATEDGAFGIRICEAQTTMSRPWHVTCHGANLLKPLYPLGCHDVTGKYPHGCMGAIMPSVLSSFGTILIRVRQPQIGADSSSQRTTATADSSRSATFHLELSAPICSYLDLSAPKTRFFLTAQQIKNQKSKIKNSAKTAATNTY